MSEVAEAIKGLSATIGWSDEPHGKDCGKCRLEEALRREKENNG